MICCLYLAVYRIYINKSRITLSEASRTLPFMLLRGGADRPEHCKPRSRVAIVVAFRARLQHLGIFLRHLHPFLPAITGLPDISHTHGKDI